MRAYSIGILALLLSISVEASEPQSFSATCKPVDGQRFDYVVDKDGRPFDFNGKSEDKPSEDLVLAYRRGSESIRVDDYTYSVVATDRDSIMFVSKAQNPVSMNMYSYVADIRLKRVVFSQVQWTNGPFGDRGVMARTFYYTCVVRNA